METSVKQKTELKSTDPTIGLDNDSILLKKYCQAILRLNSLKNSDQENEMIKILQEINNNVVAFAFKSKYDTFFVTALPLCLTYLNCGRKNYIKEHNESKMRLLVLEILIYFPIKFTSDYIPQMFTILYNILELDNEDNACVALKVIMDLHRKQRMVDPMKKLFQIVKKFLQTLILNARKIFEICKINQIFSAEHDLELLLDRIFVSTNLQTTSSTDKNSKLQAFSLLPRGINSLKLLTEIPNNLLLIKHYYRDLFDVEMVEISRLALSLVKIKPSDKEESLELFKNEIFYDFYSLQIKYFTLICYTVRNLKDEKIVILEPETFPVILLSFLKQLPDEFTYLRKDLIHSARYLFQSNTRKYFLPYLKEILDDNILIGKECPIRGSLRQIMYSIFADLIYYHRDLINLPEVNKAILFYSKNIHDLLNSHAIMLSVRVLQGCTDSLNRLFEKSKKDKECYLTILAKHCKIFEIYAEKIFHLANSFQKDLKEKEELAAQKNVKKPPELENACLIVDEMDFEDKLELNALEIPSYSLSDYRNLARTIFTAMKISITRINDLTQRYESFVEMEQDDLKHYGLNSLRYIDILIKLFKKSLTLLTVFNIDQFQNLNNQIPYQSKSTLNFQHTFARTRDERDAIELFSSIFVGFKLQTFSIIAKSTIDYLIKKIYKNPSLHIVAHYFLTCKYTSPSFSDILTNYLVNNMEAMGNNAEMSAIFVRLFKSVFYSVALVPAYNEPILQSYLKKLVHNSMELALSAPEPYNYFMLLRSLFRSIGGGTHDLLYREFLPLLPPLLQGLNNFQTGIHRKNMKDLFVELCLTIPVRLSTLLPYLPWLMDPLVSALNGSPNLISQGLRTLELCVDNLQPDFLHAHFELIRFDLMQSLWRNLHCQNELIAQTSFRILGKLGGTNHRMINEPQKLEYIELNDQIDENPDNQKNKIHSHGCCSYMDIKFDDPESIVHLPVDKIIEAAYLGIRMSTTSTYYRQHCWQVIQGFLIANIQNFSKPEDKKNLHQILSHPSFTTGTEFGYCSSNSMSFSSTFSNLNFYKFPDEKMRKVHELALTGMIMASAIKELNKSVVDFMIPLVRHYTMVAICQQSGPISGCTNKLHGMDPLVLIDAMIAVMAQEEKELCKPCNFLLRTIIETSSSLLGDLERACQLPLYNYILERFCALCYERAWYSKYGGCLSVRYLFERMSRQWVLSHQFVIFKAMMFVMNDLSCDLSSGVIEMVKDNLESMIRVSGTLPENSPKELVDLQKKSINDIVQDLLRQITSNNSQVRNYSIYLLEELAKVLDCTVSEVIRPHKEFLDEMVPFKKHRLLHQPAAVQIGILEGNTFCITLDPPLFTIDLEIREHKAFLEDICTICSRDDNHLQKYTKNTELLIPLRKAALRTLTACHFITPLINTIHRISFNALTSSEIELQECAYECLKKYNISDKIKNDSVIDSSMCLIQNIINSNINISKYMEYMKRIKYLTKLFPFLATKNLCDHMIANLMQIKMNCFTIFKQAREKEFGLRNVSKQTDNVINDLIEIHQSSIKIQKQLSSGAEIINILCLFESATVDYIDKLFNIMIKTEHALDIHAFEVYYQPLKRFIQRYPKEAVAEMRKHVNDATIFRFFFYVLNDNETDVFRAVLYEDPYKITEMIRIGALSLIQKQNSLSIININNQQTLQQVQVATSSIDLQSSPITTANLANQILSNIDPAVFRYRAIKLIYTLVKHNNNWLSGQPEIAKYLKTIWISDSYYIEYENLFKDNHVNNEPLLLMKCLLNYLSNNKMEIDIYFQLLKVHLNRYYCSFDILRDYLENIIKEYSIEWKRKAVFRFNELFQVKSSILPNIECPLTWSQDLKNKILQYLIIPLFKNAFETDQKVQFLGSLEDDKNLVNLYMEIIVQDTNVNDIMQILVMQLGSLIVQNAPDYIYAKNKDHKVRLLMQYAWPCVNYTNKRQDSVKKSYSFYLLSCVISKLSIHKNITRTVFHGLLKGSAIESRHIIFCALKIFIPILPDRLNAGYPLFRQVTKKYLVDEANQTTMEYFHLIQIIIKFHHIFYPTRHIYLPHLMVILQRVIINFNLTFENRKLVLDIIEIIIRWELYRTGKLVKLADVELEDSESRVEQEQNQTQNKMNSRKIEESLSYGPVDKEYSDIIISTLIKSVIVISEIGSNLSNNFNPIIVDRIARRAFTLLKIVFKNEFWLITDINISNLDNVLINFINTKENSATTSSICLIFDLLTVILQSVNNDMAFKLIEPLQRSIVACCTCTYPKVVSSVNSFLTKLISLDTERYFKQLYADMHSIITNGFNQFKNSQLIAIMNVMNTVGMNPLHQKQNQMLYQQQTNVFVQLFNVLMCLKARCINDPEYIDLVAPIFISAMQKLADEHVKFNVNKIPSTDYNNTLCYDMIIMCFDLIKNRFNEFNFDIRRSIIQHVFVILIDKSKEIKVLKSIIKMLDEWIKQPQYIMLFKEKVFLIVRIGQNITNRFSDDAELVLSFLELIHYMFSDENLKTNELLQKMEFAFITGMSCIEPEIRQKFFNILTSDMRARIYDRLMYILTGQNWEFFESWFWIKQCIHFILSLTSTNEPISSSNQNAKLPLPISFIPLNDSQEKLLTSLGNNNNLDLVTSSSSSTDISSHTDLANCDEDVQMVDISKQNGIGHASAANDRKQEENNFSNDIFNENDGSKPTIKTKILKIVCSFLEQNSNYKCSSFYDSVTQLCYMDSNLAQHIWIQLFPRIYSTLNNQQQTMVATEISPFLLSGIHLRQRDMPISPITTFFEAIYYCNPPIKFRPSILRYLAKNYGAWHRATLILESDINAPNRSLPGVGGLVTNEGNINYTAPKSTRSLSAQSNGDRVNLNNVNDLLPPDIPASLFPSHPQQCMSAMAELYDTFKESDYWTGIWIKRAQYKETLIAIAYEQQGFYEQAKGAYELAMNKGINEHSYSSVSNSLQDEYMIWEEHWIRCSKELNQWDFIIEYGSNPDFSNPIAVLESAWRIPDWNAMQNAVIALENNVPAEFTWKYYLYKGYNALCNPNNRDVALAEKMADSATNYLLKYWRRLPPIVSSAHVVILQGAHQIIELQEAIVLQNTVNNGMVDSRSVIKTWKNRLPIVADDLSYWSDIFTWRLHHYQAIVNKFDTEEKAQMALSASHATAQSLILLAKVARKHFLINVALDRLHRIHTIPKVPLIDCFQKIRQQLKCYLLKHSIQPTGEELQEAMDVISSTHLKYFYSEMVAEFVGLKGYVLMKMGRFEEADKNFSASLQIVDTMVKSWAMWAELNYEKFMKTIQPFENRDLAWAKNAIISYLHASRAQNECRTRKYLSNAIWLLAYDKDCILASTLAQYIHGVPPSNWVPWIQQLLNCLNRPEADSIVSIINHISKFHPEAVYFPVRTLYLTMKMEHREMKIKYAMAMNANNQMGNSSEQVQASAGLWKCSRIMHTQREIYPTLLTSIEGILDSMTWFRENWCEEILRQLRQCLAKCNNIAFENRDNVAETKITTYILNYFKKLINTFGIGLDSTSYNTSSFNVGDLNNQTPNKTTRNLYTTTSESLAMRAQSLIQDQDYQHMKAQFSTDFDFTGQDSQKLSYLIVKIKKWIKTLESKTKLLPKYWHLEEKCRFLSNFSQQTIEVSIPGEHFLPKLNKMCVIKIARFMPRVEVVNKHNSSPRRLYIRGHNGKIYPYLICNDSSFGDSRREEQFLHILRLLNLYLSKHKETARRVISYSIPRVVPISIQMRFVEENVSSLSLIDIYKQDVIRRGSDPDAPIGKYYDQLFNHQSKGTKVSLVHLKEIITDVQTTIAPATLIKDWAFQTFPNACEYWHFRKLFTIQLGLTGMTEYAFYLCRLNPDMLYIHRDSGLVNVAYYRFEFDNNAELISLQPVPFRITNSIQNFITDVGINGPMTGSMIASASCFTHPNHKIRPMLLAIFRDEIANWFKNNHKLNYVQVNPIISDNAGDKDNTNADDKVNVQTTINMNDIPELVGEELITLVNKAVNSILSRFQNLSNFDGNESHVSTLISNAINPNNLCQMDPAWHPWL